jgi:DNA helicase II / ATP-dependent DNA helicase PcrA
MKKHVIFGPPGTGKTTSMLNIVDHLLSDGTPPRRIGFIAFTRKAAHEARTRAMAKFTLAEADVPWYRTLHSSAFRLLGLNRSQVMMVGDYIEICKHLGLFITLKQVDDDGAFSRSTKGDRLFFMENISRVRGETLAKTWSDSPDEDIHFEELVRLRRTLEEYKRRTGKLDFTDMIERVVTDKLQMPVDVALVDEAQDLSPLQWCAVETLFSGTSKLYIAGDDDQAIFKWAGADSTRLLSMTADMRYCHSRIACQSMCSQSPNR